jgi:cytochrome c oxidase assembly factor CtaG/cytochrome c2
MRIGLAFALALLPVVVSAHGGSADPRVLSPWDVAVVGGLIGTALLYAAGLRRLQQRGAAIRRLVLERFSAHMLQHELLMVVAVPLVVAGRPLAVCLWGVPNVVRPSAGRVFQGRAVAGGWRLLTAPVVAWMLHGLAVWVWHAPKLYDLAVRNESVHALQHATFVGTAVLFWWGLVYGRYGRAGYGASVFYVFTTAVHTGILGALLTFAGSPLYDVYAGRGGDVLADQQVAGVVMWVPAGLVLTVAGIGLFAAWLGEAERRRPRTTIVLVLIAAGLASGCSDDRNRETARALTGGEPTRGPQAIRKYGCDTCHTIPGVLEASATVGPPLTQIARRTYLAGRIPNTPENMLTWIRHPKSIDDKTAMPEMGVSMQDGRDIAAYLYTLR